MLSKTDLVDQETLARIQDGSYAKRFLEEGRSGYPLMTRAREEMAAAGYVDLAKALESLVPRDLAALRWQPVDTVLLAPLGHPLAGVRRVVGTCRGGG